MGILTQTMLKLHPCQRNSLLASRRKAKGNEMTKIYKAYVYEEPCGRFMGEIDGIYINTNIGEIKNTPIEFYADSKQALLADMVKFLKGTGHTRILRVANQELSASV